MTAPYINNGALYLPCTAQSSELDAAYYWDLTDSSIYAQVDQVPPLADGSPALAVGAYGDYLDQNSIRLLLNSGAISWQQIAAGVASGAQVWAGWDRLAQRFVRIRHSSIPSAPFAGAGTLSAVTRVIPLTYPALTGAGALSASTSLGAVHQFTGVVYSQSSVYGGTTAADYTYMNDGNADGSKNNNETGTNNDLTAFVMADCGAVHTIDHIVIGYDYLTNLPGGFGPTYTNGANVQGSNNNSTWTTITNAPTWDSTNWPNGLVPISINANWRYIRLMFTNNYIACLEFQIWGI